MKKLKILYILSMVGLGLLVALAVFRPLVSGGQYTEVQKQSLLRREGDWLIKFDVVNHEGKDVTYNIDVLVDGQLSTSTVLVRNEKAFTYMKEVTPAASSYKTATLPALAYTVPDNLDPSPSVVVNGWSTAEGVYTATVTATDAAGNIGSASVTYTVDNTPP